MDKKTRQVIDDLRGGRNGFDAAWAIKDNQCADAVNVDWYKARFANKRGGMLATATTFSAGGPFAGILSFLGRHIPGTDDTAAELWAVDDTLVVGRLAGAVTFTSPTPKDALTGNGWDFTATSINGKYMTAYKSAVDRHHCWDGTAWRRTGLAATVAPTAANTGSGAYAATLRYYRQRSTVQASGVTIRRSEPSPYVAFTPSAAGTGVVITQAAVINEGETHWEVEASTDSVTFYRIATVAIGTTTYTDSAIVTSYNTNPLSDLTGKYQLQKAYKFVASDQNRQLGFGSYNAADKQARIEISAVIGSADVSDEERVDTSAVNSIIDFDENDSGFATGLVGPVLGGYMAFKDRQTWFMTATGTPSQPYRTENVSKSIGAVSHYAITRGEDAIGNAALYWMSHRGPYRYSVLGLEYIGRNIEDYILGGNASINLAATRAVARTIFHFDKRQVWFWVATGSSNDPNVLFIYDVQTGGFSRVPSTDALANVRCAVMFSNTIGTSMSRDLKPYVGQTGAVNRLWKADTGTDDNGTAFQSYVITKAAEPGGPGFYGEIGDADLLAKAAAGVMITDTVTADFGAQLPKIGTADLTPKGTETRVAVRIEDSALGGVSFVQHQVGDASAIANSWTLDRLVVPYTKRESRTA